jgi:hypothetical protein
MGRHPKLSQYSRELISTSAILTAYISDVKELKHMGGWGRGTACNGMMFT